MREEAVTQFFRAVGGGTVGGSLFFVWLTIPGGIGTVLAGNPVEGLWFALAPVAIVGGITMLAAVLIGLPLTAILRARSRECRKTYAVVGLLCGAIIPIVASHELPPVGFILAVPGMIAGSITGSLWGDYRRSLTSSSLSP